MKGEKEPVSIEALKFSGALKVAKHYFLSAAVLMALSVCSSIAGAQSLETPIDGVRLSQAAPVPGDSAVSTGSNGTALTAIAQQNAPASAQQQASPSGQAPIPTQNVTQQGSVSTIATPTTPDGLKPEPGLYNKPCVCQAQLAPGDTPPGKQKHKILKGLGKELGMEMGDLGKDMFMAFSVQGNDPYEMPKHPDIPYIAAEAQFVDGSNSNLYKYPDESWRIQGGFLAGTYACKQADGLYIVQYPNGARGTMKMTETGCEVLRPDNTVTTITKAGGGSYKVNNSKLGYMGDISPDTTGLSYEFAKQNF
jgi:hypothetical protein